MAGKGISINFLANVRDFLRGTDDVEESFEEVAESLDDVAKDGDKAAERLEKSFKDLEREVNKDSRSMNQNLKRNIEDGTRSASDDLKELGDEAKQNFAELFSSFDGSPERIADAVQGTLGGLVSSLGPVGMALGAAGAAGVGLIVAGLTQAEEQAQAARERVSELANELIESGDNGELSIGYIAEQLREIATTSDKNAVNLSKVRREAEVLGVEFKDLALSYAGSSDNIEEQIALVEKLIEEENRRYRENTTAGNVYQGFIGKTTSALEAQRDSLQKVADATAEARQQEKDWIEAGGPAIEARAAAISSVNDAYDAAATAVDEYTDKESGVFNAEEYITQMRAKAEELKNYQAALESAALSDEAKQFLAEQGVEAASAMLSAYESASASQKSELNQIWTEAAKENSGAYEQELKQSMPETIDGPLIVPDIPTGSSMIRELQAQLSGRELKIPVSLVTRDGEKVY